MAIVVLKREDVLTHVGVVDSMDDVDRMRGMGLMECAVVDVDEHVDGDDVSTRGQCGHASWSWN